jgi:hypothetical protein
MVAFSDACMAQQRLRLEPKQTNKVNNSPPMRFPKGFFSADFMADKGGLF